MNSLEQVLPWLQDKAVSMIRASRSPMWNGVSAFPPQVGSHYAAFWLRDFAYQQEGCVEAFSSRELTDACRLFVGAIGEDGAGVDCVKFDGTPVYKPGYGSMGERPVADGSQFTVDVAWQTWKATNDRALLAEIIGRLVATMEAVPRNPLTKLVHIATGGWDRCPYGFTDSVRKQGDELFCSLLFVQSSRRLSELLLAARRREEAHSWMAEAELVAASVRRTFWDAEAGLFLAATDLCRQPDIWGSAFSVELGVASPEQALAIARYFQSHYRELVEKGQVRHLPGGMYWDVACPRDSYQNGAYWATPTGWFVTALDLVDPRLADQTLMDLVEDFRARGVSEWVFGADMGVMDYLSSVTLPLAGAKKLLARRAPREKSSRVAL